MPRAARLDIAGVLQHVIARGIERRNIFLDDQGRHSFLDRFSVLLAKMDVQCLAWVLMSNHFHLLLRPTHDNLGQFMRRLLTGYAVTFNLRHKRTGHLFQNRYKSVVCEDDPYLLELVRYIHLNPIRAGLIRTLQQLKVYPWSGHAVIMGKRELPGQNAEEVLLYFSQKRKHAREKYQSFIAEGIEAGRREEFAGGGLRRVLKVLGNDVISDYDDRILGSEEYVVQLRQEKEMTEKLEVGPPLPQLIRDVAELAGVEPSALCQRRRGTRLSEVKSVICYAATRMFGYSGEAVAKALGITRSGVCRGAARGEKYLLENVAFSDEIQKIINRSTTSP